MPTISAAELRIGDIIEAQMGHPHIHSRKGSLHRSWSVRRWKLTEVSHDGTVKVRGETENGLAGNTEFYRENRVSLIERPSA